MASSDTHQVEPAASSTEQVESCVFCRIATGKAESTMVFENHDFVAFRDIKPVAEHHYLVIPRRHIRNAKQLQFEDLQMIEQMVATGKSLLEERNLPISDVKLGFHWPPFTMVQHLHLHVIAPASGMGFLSRLIFRPSSLWYVTADWLLERLKGMEPPGET